MFLVKEDRQILEMTKLCYIMLFKIRAMHRRWRYENASKSHNILNIMQYEFEITKYYLLADINRHKRHGLI